MREAETPVEFVPPDDLRPGQLGTLVDFKANPLDVTATIVDLAVRGYLKIEEVDEGVVPVQARLEAHQAAEGRRAAPLRAHAVDGLFRDGDEVKLSDLQEQVRRRA